jgi:tetratricopeptide (TPR) repeat protein
MRHRAAVGCVLVVTAVCGLSAQTAVVREEPIHESLNLEANNFGALKARTFVLLERHEFAAALEQAKALHRKVPDDLVVRSYMADAYTELGDYGEAVTATQELMNLRAGNVLGLTRAAKLRELHGDYPGAMDFLHKAYDATPAEETRDRASLLAKLAHVQLLGGNLPEAETFANGALGAVADCGEALGVLAQVRLAQNRNDEAIALLEKRNAKTPRAANVFALAEALDHAGRKEAAAKAFADFEQAALKESTAADNANNQLAEYYAEYAHQPAKALEICVIELARRHDAFTLDVYARSLAASGDYVRAENEMQKALTFGSKNTIEPRHIEANQGSSARTLRLP